jgi:AcrR family transcriptional regulator
VAKVKRQPTSSLRADRAQVTSRRITEAARRLFATRGYGATTLEAVASEAGVAVQTVYAVHRSKAGILRALLEAVMRQPEAEVLYEQAMSEPNAGRKVELFARSIRNRWERGSDVVAIHEEAGRTEPAVRKDVDRVLSVRRAGLRRLAGSLTSALKAGVDKDRATAILDALTLPGLYRQLVEIHDWTPDDYESWLSATLAQQLLAQRGARQG